jgi:hypothetical protein
VRLAGFVDALFDAAEGESFAQFAHANSVNGANRILSTVFFIFGWFIVISSSNPIRGVSARQLLTIYPVFHNQCLYDG